MLQKNHIFISGDKRLPILITKRKGARSIVLRYQPLKHALTLTLPPYVSIRKGLGFIEKKQDWVHKQLAKHQDKIPFADGSMLPVLGTEYRLTHVGGRGVVRMEHGQLFVPGDPTFMARRVRDWLKKTAYEAISQRAHTQADLLGCTIRKITLRDTRSLWGSCTRNGHLSFSWRLLLAPPEVLDYLVSHEVAHLVEMNHSKRFWTIVETLCPHWRTSRHWLKKHGDRLFRYG